MKEALLSSSSLSSSEEEEEVVLTSASSSSSTSSSLLTSYTFCINLMLIVACYSSSTVTIINCKLIRIDDDYISSSVSKYLMKFSPYLTKHKHNFMNPTSSSIEDVYIGLLLPNISHMMEFYAFGLALNLVNDERNGIIKAKSRLKLVYTYSHCQLPVATEQFFNIVNSSLRIQAIITSGCHDITGPLSEISAYFNITQITYSSSDVSLGEREKYPNLIRTIFSDYCFSHAVIAVLEKFNWTRVGILYQEKPGLMKLSTHSLVNSHLVHEMEKKGYKTLNYGFTIDPTESLRKLKKHNIRIIIGNFHSALKDQIFCVAFREGMLGRHFQWITYSQDSDGDENVKNMLDIHWDCDVYSTKQYHISLQHSGFWEHSNQNILSNNMSPGQFKRIMSTFTTNHTRPSFVPDNLAFAFDSIRALALSVNESNIYRQNLLQVPIFFGLTGPFTLHDGERNCLVEITQYIEGNYRFIGYYSELDERVFVNESELKWPFGVVPKDRSQPVQIWQTINPVVYAVFVFLTSIGILFAIFLMAVNIRFRKHKYIKMSSPNMNNIIILGTVFTYVSVIFLGLDSSTISVPTKYIRILCSIKGWILCFGFSLSFGAMFSKTWRVHQIFTNITLNKKVIKDYQLMVIVAVLVILDVSLLTLQHIIDPMQLKIENRTTFSIAQQIEIVYFQESCSSDMQSLWIGIVYAHKGFLLLIGCFLAWETRRVNIPALNDSRHIGISVYMVVLLCSSGAAVNALVQDMQTFRFAIIAGFVIACASMTLLVVFLPKLIQLKRDPCGVTRRVQATVIQKNRISNRVSSEVMTIQRTNTDPVLRNRLSELNSIKSSLELAIKSLSTEEKEDDGGGDEEDDEEEEEGEKVKKSQAPTSQMIADEDGDDTAGANNNNRSHSTRSEYTTNRNVTLQNNLGAPHPHCSRQIVKNRVSSFNQSSFNFEQIDYRQLELLCRNLPETDV